MPHAMLDVERLHANHAIGPTVNVRALRATGTRPSRPGLPKFHQSEQAVVTDLSIHTVSLLMNPRRDTK
jgi:hypothetical protein